MNNFQIPNNNQNTQSNTNSQQTSANPQDQQTNQQNNQPQSSWLMQIAGAVLPTLLEQFTGLVKQVQNLSSVRLTHEKKQIELHGNGNFQHQQEN